MGWPISIPSYVRQWKLGPPREDLDWDCTAIASVWVDSSQFGLSASWDLDSLGLQVRAMVGPVELHWHGPPVAPDPDEPARNLVWHVAGRRIELSLVRRHVGVLAKWAPPYGSAYLAVGPVGVGVEQES